MATRVFLGWTGETALTADGQRLRVAEFARVGGMFDGVLFTLLEGEFDEAEAVQH